MLKLIKENFEKIIVFVQQKYGELTDEEIGNAREDVGRLPILIEEKFGVPKDKVEEDIRSYLGHGFDKLGELQDTAENMLGGFGQPK